jgi:hypothetical protein
MRDPLVDFRRAPEAGWDFATDAIVMMLMIRECEEDCSVAGTYDALVAGTVSGVRQAEFVGRVSILLDRSINSR